MVVYFPVMYLDVKLLRVNSYRTKARPQTELRIITEVDREICNPQYSTDQQECPKYYWRGLLAAGIIAGSTL